VLRDQGRAGQETTRGAVNKCKDSRDIQRDQQPSRLGAQQVIRKKNGVSITSGDKKKAERYFI
jgi:hypothetical protein